MYNFLKIGAVIVTGRFLKPRFKGLLILIAFWIIVRFLHAEYLSYVALTDDTTFVVSAALAKIGLYLLGFFVYVLVVERRILKRTAADIEARQEKQRSTPAYKDDGFDFLRQKKKLHTPAEQLLKKD